MKRKMISLVGALLVLALAVGCANQGSGGQQNFPKPASSAQSARHPVPPGEEYDPEMTVIFQSKNKQIYGVLANNKEYIPLVEFVEDMGYTYTIAGDTVTVHNSDYNVNHVLTVGRAVVVTGDQQRTMFGTLRYYTVDGQEKLYTPTQLYDIFVGNFSD